MTEGRKGDFMALASGRIFWPLDPRPEEIFVEDIAHHLSMICRYAGGTRWFFPVSQHSVLIARWLRSQDHPPVVQMCGLLHDAPEPFTGFGDIIGPVKDQVPIVSKTEDAIWKLALAPKFGLPQAIPRVVHEADIRIRADEQAQVLNPCDVPWGQGIEPLGVEILRWTPEEARTNFLMEFDIISDDMARHKLVEGIENG